MALLEGPSGSIQEVNDYFKSARVSIYPLKTLGWNSLGVKSGAVTGVAANGAVFSFRNISANPVIVRRVGIGCVTTTAFTTAQVVDYGIFFARAFTASDTAQTAVAITGNNTKHRTSLATPTSLDVRVSNTGAITAGTRTLDTNALGNVAAWSGGQGQGLNLSPDNLVSQSSGDYPLVFVQNEGFVIANLTAMGAAGVVNLYVNIEFCEVENY